MKNTKNEVTFATVVRNALSASNWNTVTRLYKEMDEKGYDISYDRLCKYWNGKKVPSMEDAKKILYVLRVDTLDDQQWLPHVLDVSKKAITEEKEQRPAPSKATGAKADTDFKTLLKKELERAGMNACHLSRSMGLTSYTVSRWLTGINKPTFEHAKEAFSILGTNITDEEIRASIGISTPADAAKPERDTVAKEKKQCPAPSKVNGIKAGDDFKTLLKKELERTGMGVCHLGKAMGLTHCTVSMWLKGSYKPTFAHAKEAFSILGTNISDKEVYASLGISIPTDAAKPDVEVAKSVKEERAAETRSEAQPSAAPTISLADDAATLHTLAADLHAIATFLTIAQQSMATYFATAK